MIRGLYRAFQNVLIGIAVIIGLTAITYGLDILIRKIAQLTAPYPAVIAFVLMVFTIAIVVGELRPE